jgi:hypothetical protein
LTEATGEMQSVGIHLCAGERHAVVRKLDERRVSAFFSSANDQTIETPVAQRGQRRGWSLHDDTDTMVVA